MTSFNRIMVVSALNNGSLVDLKPRYSITLMGVRSHLSPKVVYHNIVVVYQVCLVQWILASLTPMQLFIG